tara:strand:+ start:450 stop:650 length:201 start_codon:yes stop_codon:yes gene_type:complete
MNSILNIINPHNIGSVGNAISTLLNPVTSARETDIGVQKNNRKNKFLKLKTDTKTTVITIGKTSNK